VLYKIYALKGRVELGLTTCHAVVAGYYNL